MADQFKATVDQFDIRDVIERFEELEADRDNANSPAVWTVDNPDLYEELALIEKLLDETRGRGGDEEWRGDWYPLGFIHKDYFKDAMEELVKDIDGLPKDIPAYLVIDWEATAENLKVDYSSVTIDGEEFYYR